MSISKKRAAQQASAKIISARKRLKSLGLFSDKVDLRKSPTRYQKRVIKSYADVLEGRASVVSAKNSIQARKFKNSFRVKGSKIIVPRAKGERVSFSKDTSELRTSRTVGGKRVTKTIANGQLAPLKPGQYYVMAFAGGQRFRTNDISVLLAFMQGYEKKAQNPFKDWRKYVEIETVEDSEGEETVAMSKHKPKFKVLGTGKRKKRTNKKGRSV